MSDQGEYEIALSFAGEDRAYVADVAAALQRAEIRVFYDKYEKASLWGKDLYVHLSDVYRRASGYIVMFISEHYARKLWTNHERKSAQARAFEERREYILPARFDDTEVPGILPTTGYVDLRETSPEELAALILEKLGRGPSAVASTPKPDHRAILDLIVKVQARQASLAACVAEALALARACGTPDFIEFCTNELVGYRQQLSETEIKLRAYRAMQVHCIAGRLNLSTFGYRGESPMTFIHENPDKFTRKLYFISEPIASLEAHDTPKSPAGCLYLVLSLGMFTRDAADPATPIYCYAEPTAYQTIAEGVRAELTRRLNELLTS